MSLYSAPAGLTDPTAALPPIPTSSSRRPDSGRGAAAATGLGASSVYARRRRATASAQRPSAKSAAIGGSGTAAGSMIRSNP